MGKKLQVVLFESEISFKASNPTVLEKMISFLNAFQLITHNF